MVARSLCLLRCALWEGLVEGLVAKHWPEASTNRNANSGDSPQVSQADGSTLKCELYVKCAQHGMLDQEVASPTIPDHLQTKHKCIVHGWTFSTRQGNSTHPLR